VELIAEQAIDHQGADEKAATLAGAPRKDMDHKIAVLKKMYAFSRAVRGHMVGARKVADTPQAGRCMPWC